MLVINKPSDIAEMVKLWKNEGESIGLVPTMGFLHEGHLSLIRSARTQCDRTVVSIYVNPTQFGPGEDLTEYPRDLEKDIALLEKEGTDLIFAPTDTDMYDQDHCTQVRVQGLSDKLAGEHRPTHFGGVTTVCAKLFNIVQADKGFFGQKDFQQVAIIRKMVQDLNFGIMIVMLPIVREESGLALSSRNMYLSTEQKVQALSLSKSLKIAAELKAQGQKDARAIVDAVVQFIKSQGPSLDLKYAVIVDAQTLEPVQEVKTGNVLLLEAYIGKTRLYDNFIF